MRTLLRILAWTGAFASVMLPLRAAHFSGGNITYECLGGNQYLVELDLFIDCSGVAVIPQDLSFQSDCGQQFDVLDIPVTPGLEVSQLCAAELPNSTCNGGPLPGIEVYTFQTVVNLPPCDGWTISWAVCCRNTTVNLQANPGIYVEATLNNATAPCNNSPLFTDQSLPYVCANQVVNYNMGVTESDGDSLAYSLISAQYAAPLPTPTNYSPGFSGGSPIPGITVDPITGQLTFTPTITGNFVVSVLVEEFDDAGNLLGTVMRDLMVTVLNCTGQAPVPDGILGSSGGVITGTSSIEVCDGEFFCIDLGFSDADASSSLTVVSQAVNLLPGATFSVAGTNPVVATICWTADPAYSPVNVLVQASDGACPIQNQASTSLNIVVDPSGGVPDAGLDAALAICGLGPPVDLFSELGGTPGPGGVWEDPSGDPHSGSFDPSSDPVGAYTYSITNGCGSDASTVTVSLAQPPDAGTDGT
ncbi:MAG: hypothetical protein KDC03_16915, partial [Flavobacteriales bacterium]|nr:hypothetical protein [Flavobacteriales bacterium]